VIRHFYIDNFKSLVDFHLPMEPAHLGKFTCLIGINGTGKSTVLQAFDFVKQLVHGRLDDWLEVRDWKKSDLTSRFLRKHLIGFRLVFEFPEIGTVIWEGQFNPNLLRCTSESIRLDERDLLKFAEDVVRFDSAEDNKRLVAKGFYFQGSVFSALRLDNAHPAIRAVRAFVYDLKSLDMLAPNLMRRRHRDAEDVGYGGERLSAFLYGFSKSAHQHLLDTLKQFYPQVFDVVTSSLRGGYKDLRVFEQYPDHRFPVNARQLNDGMLRILAIVSQVDAKDEQKRKSKAEREFAKLLKLPVHREYRALLFDEIENGIHPELIEKLVTYLLEAQQQIIVTTHSPMILNYLPDDVAQEAVILLYRTADGITRSARYFDLPSTRKKLELLGPGEVFVDTDLSILTQEAEASRNASL
jgi:predicted ATPase